MPERQHAFGDPAPGGEVRVVVGCQSLSGAVAVGDAESERDIVSFDVSPLAPIVAVSDTVLLKLFVVDNAENWGNTGRTIDAHQVLAAWQEGDGANMQPGNLTQAEFNPFQNRGDGPGVTWKCAVDAEVHNQRTDCETPWNGGLFDPAPTDTVTIYKDFAGNSTLPPTTATTGWIEFDITADVLECLASGAPTCSWLIKKTQEGQEGRVEFATKEGAAALYDALYGEPVAPRLELAIQASSVTGNTAADVTSPDEGVPALRLPLIGSWATLGGNGMGSSAEGDVAGHPPTVLLAQPIDSGPSRLLLPALTR